MYVQVAGIPYMMRNLYGFDLEQVCLVYLTMWWVRDVITLMQYRRRSRLLCRSRPGQGVHRKGTDAWGRSKAVRANGRRRRPRTRLLYNWLYRPG
jgi:hypothetical protein